jgi:hypothetical protein
MVFGNQETRQAAIANGTSKFIARMHEIVEKPQEILILKEQRFRNYI